ncbi:translation initiation factor [Sulfurovum sp.]|jgi:translation initiation factor 1|uniref:translation initiation factor n=1 Tax=Sulfurovum sp. TaxID=1969726 RepID=UPI002A35E899|nr:translation initiation factor [Sulfurovum sp.]MDD2450957.1 translation initiation factor [Sulfurovum sp.]MDD3498916.1 translation initiation factor [Sulfurovum sp.]MDY0402686.1 translation initiation factor [Sulfurovum sp.]
MKENLFEMGANFEDGWSSNNKEKPAKNKTLEVKAPEKHQLYFAKEKRRGKVVTIVKPFHLEKQELQTLLKTLKKKLGTGGTAKEESLEFQGEIAEMLRGYLEALGYRFKK